MKTPMHPADKLNVCTQRDTGHSTEPTPITASANSGDPPLSLNANDGEIGDVMCVCFGALLGSMKRAELVAVWISYIGQVHRAQLSFTQARGLLDRGTAVGDRRVVELVHLLG